MYSIPNPNRLVDSITNPNRVNIQIFDTTDNTTSREESRMFFIEHPDIFRTYLAKIENNIPDNFNIYIQNILTDIKTKNLDDVDEYWLNMKGGRRRKRNCVDGSFQKNVFYIFQRREKCLSDLRNAGASYKRAL